MSKLEQMAKAMQKLDGKSVKIGVMDGRYPDGTSVVEVAIFNEFGTADIKPRPFIRQAEQKSKSDLTKVQAHLIKKLQNGQASVSDVLSTTGEWYQGRVQNEITNGNFVANSPLTVARKGSSNPLIDTGLLRSSIKWKKHDV